MPLYFIDLQRSFNLISRDEKIARLPLGQTRGLPLGDPKEKAFLRQLAEKGFFFCRGEKIVYLIYSIDYQYIYLAYIISKFNIIGLYLRAKHRLFEMLRISIVNT